MVGYKAEASKLLKGVIRTYGGVEGAGSFSCSVYDTAWLSMVTKIVDDEEIWLFPTSFGYVLNSQQANGSWEEYAAPIDGILNTLAALLALCRHRLSPLQISELMHLDIDTRISRAEAVLRDSLHRWDVASTIHVGYELLVPQLLQMLEEFGFAFEFPGKDSLLALHAQKMSHFDNNLLYQTTQTTALHSLEAFIGKIDFDKIKHQTRMGSMLASPSSTAAYLQYSKSWDSDSEEYLHRVISCGEGKGNGGVPSAFPTSNFETIWVVSTLLEGGFTQDELGRDELAIFVKMIESSFQAEGGLLGFAPCLVPDADDTSQAITVLNKLGIAAPVAHMVKAFEAPNHFKTYPSERTSSFSANCNVLKALLSSERLLDDYSAQIQKVTQFICENWWNSDGCINDKWNLSPHYSEMLMSQSLVRFLLLWDQGKLPKFETNAPIIENILIALFQALTRILRTQDSNGAWDEGRTESSAYAILALVCLEPLPMATSLRPYIRSAIERGRDYIEARSGDITTEHTWIEKVSYGMKPLHRAYTLAALNPSTSTSCFEGRFRDVTTLPTDRMAKFKGLYSKLPLFAEVPQWLIEAALIESYMYLPRLKQIRLRIFPREDMEEDKYFEYIPFTWTATNLMQNGYYRANFLFDMMQISFLNYQADEYMESVVGPCFVGRLTEIREIIDALFDKPDPRMNRCNGEASSATDPDIIEDTVSNAHANPGRNHDSLLQEAQVRQTLERFVNHILCHTGVQSAGEYDKRHLRQEVRLFLQAHVDQIEDSHLLSSQQNGNATYQNPKTTFFEWIRTTSSNHTSCPYSFAFAMCLLGDRKDFLSTAAEKYIGEAACRHLAALCRMYNDYGSLRRDRLERNLNSLHFPEFQEAPSLEHDEVLKRRLFQLASYERKSLDLAVSELGLISHERVMRFIRMFVDVTDMYGQIYIEKDIASRMK